MKINNCYEAALRMFELSEELSILLNENQKAKTEREKEIMKIAINDRSLISIEEKNKSRADILKGMVMVILS